MAQPRSTVENNINNMDDEYEPDENKLVRERIVAYLKHIEGEARPLEIANAIDASSNYIYGELRDLHEEGTLHRREGEGIIGYPMPDGGLTPLPDDRDRLLEVVEEHAPWLLDDAEGLSLPNLRTLIESEIVEGDPRQMRQQKVYYSYAAG